MAGVNNFDFDDDDGDDVNDSLRRFYQARMILLRRIHFNMVPPNVVRDIAVMLHRTLLFDAAWMETASQFGIEDNHLLSKIFASAKTSNELPLFITLNSYLQHDKSFGDIIETLLTLNRMDILQKIKPCAERLMSLYVKSCQERDSSEEFSTDTDALSSIDTFSDKTFENKSFQNESSESEKSVTHEKLSDCTKSSSDFKGTTLVVNLEMQKSSLCKDLNLGKNEVHSLALRKDILSVFIQHTEEDTDIAEELSQALKQNGILSRTYSDLEHIIFPDSVTALRGIVKEVDFVVPVVSEIFLQQVWPNINVQYLESSDAMNNRYLYKLIMNHFQTNQCINFKTKPVLVPNLKRDRVKSDLILSSALRLWKEVPKLVTLLKKTKELIPQLKIIEDSSAFD